jgi:hypothetical protein
LVKYIVETESLHTDKELLNQFKAIEKMPERNKDVVKTLMLLLPKGNFACSLKISLNISFKKM